MDRKEFFEKVADEWEKEHSRPEANRELPTLIEKFSLQPGQKVLDAGCGTGRLIPFIRSAIGPTGLVVAVDFASQMVAYARKKYSAPNLIIFQADVTELPLTDNFFDRIILLALFPHLPEKLKSLREMHRLLKPGGQLFIAHTSGRQEINSYHAQLAYPICEDFLPEAYEMHQLFSAAELEILEFIDEPNLYLVSGRKK
ncbi:MAG: class I SAM-dependent methyltransferase [Candidatus Saccharicenans sp.]|nr:MAG: ubiquinone biosynthesis protein UbiE [Candidatus Aminicenantes bacterium]HEK85165.1 class I SAM-dependent methyltransferase [Candidatus Aminicenantes bacterium]